MATKSTRRVYPLPEAIDGKRWNVDDGRPQVDMTARRMFVPLADTPEDRFLRAHETAHARITPKVSAAAVAKKNGVSGMAVQVCEDARVHAFLNRRGIETTGAVSIDEARGIAKRIAGSDREIAAAMVSVRGTGDYDRIIDALAGAGVDENRVESIAEGARQVCSMIWASPSRRGMRHPVEIVQGFAKRTIPAARLFDTLFPDSPGDQQNDGMREAIARVMRDGYLTDRDGKWGDLEPIAKAPLSAPRKRGQGETRTFRDEGVIPNAVHRLTVDGRIFSRQRKAPGGTVLVDASGSMGLSADELSAIVDAAPSGTVAIYCGRRTIGRIVIVADRGRQATIEAIQRSRIGGGNIIDGPALRWLANQPKPRIWVSDGYVTGKNDTLAKNLLVDAAAIVRHGSIVRVDGASDAAAMLRASRGLR